MKIYFFCKTIPIRSRYARMKLHIGKTNPESLEEIHLSAKKRQQKVFFCLLLAHLFKGSSSKIHPTHLIPSLLLEHMADFGLRLYNLPFLFDLNKTFLKH